jgi:peptide-methionine (S)-S-oxide reductase
MGDHTETVQIDFDPKVIGYRDLVRVFWSEYRPGGYSRQYLCLLFAHDDEQRRIALEEAVSSARDAVVPFTGFFDAEDYHQKYYLRARADLMKLLPGYDDRMLLGSTAAARLNGIAGGYGGADLMDRELARLG